MESLLYIYFIKFILLCQLNFTFFIKKYGCINLKESDFSLSKMVFIYKLKSSSIKNKITDNNLF